MERKASSYLRCLISTMIHYKNKRLRIRVNEEELPVDDYLAGIVANGMIFGKGMKIAPRAKLDDGFFDLVLIKAMKFLEFCRHGWRVYMGSHLSLSKISLIQAKKIEALPQADEEVLIELDGEQIGKLPAIFEIVPLNLLVKGYP